MSEEVAQVVGDIAYWQCRAQAAEADAAALNDSCQAWIESEGRWRQRAEPAEQERDAARAVVVAAQAALDAPLFEHRAPLEQALAAYAQALDHKEPAP